MDCAPKSPLSAECVLVYAPVNDSQDSAKEVRDSSAVDHKYLKHPQHLSWQRSRGLPRISARPLYSNLEIGDDYETLPPGFYGFNAEDALYTLDQMTARRI